MFEEPEGFRDYVAARQRTLLRTARMLTGNQHTAEDLVQATLERVWPRWQRLTRDGDPDPYVRRVMINSYSSWWQRKWRGELSSSEPPEEVGGDGARVRLLGRSEIFDSPELFGRVRKVALDGHGARFSHGIGHWSILLSRSSSASNRRSQKSVISRVQSTSGASARGCAL